MEAGQDKPDGQKKDYGYLLSQRIMDGYEASRSLDYWTRQVECLASRAEKLSIIESGQNQMVLTKRIKRIHFIGIGGSGVSALAKLMLEMGYEVSGSDLVINEVTQALKAKGALIFEGHDARHVRRANLVVRSTAISEDNVEVVTAKQMSIPVLSRIDFLSYLSERKFSICVSGSHGKSTTSAMISVVFY